MPCSPNDNQINIPVFPPPSIPGFGSMFSPFQIPLDGFDLPQPLIEDFTDLIKRLQALFPSGTFNPFPDNAMKSVFDFINDIFRQIAPFLSLYNFFMALLNIIICVIEVLCAIPNPFAVASKLIKLFKECLPPFLNLFPFFALIAMLLALLLLILALIEYIIAQILAIINAIIRNIQLLSDGLSLNDAQATLAAVNKIAALLCAIQNLLSIFVALGAILSIIQALAAFAGSAICDDSDQDGCCPIALCPPFIKNTPEGVTSETAKLVYLKEVGFDSAGALGLPPEIAAIFSVPAIRKERWQVFDNSLETPYFIKEIITPILFDNFWADSVVVDGYSSPRRAQYTVDMEVTLNPNNFGNLDFQGSRKFIIKDCIVIEKPYVGIFDYQNAKQLTYGSNLGTLNGTLSIAGGLVFEEDGTTPYMISNEQATLENFISQPINVSTSIPGSDDSVSFDIKLTWKPNAAALAGYNVTTFGCIPEVSFERNIVNTVILTEGVEAIAVKLPPAPAGKVLPSTGILPNVSGAEQCVSNAIAELRTNINVETLANFQANVLTCLNDLKDQTTAVICSALNVGISQFKSTYDLSTDLQFITSSIRVFVSLKDFSGTLITRAIPASCAEDIANKLSAEVTFGKISKFSYDGESLFFADLTAEEKGSGEITVYFDGKILNTVITGAAGEASSIQPNMKMYSFVDAKVDSAVRRDETDLT
jgi:hypothetical protein